MDSTERRGMARRWKKDGPRDAKGSDEAGLRLLGVVETLVAPFLTLFLSSLLFLFLSLFLCGFLHGVSRGRAGTEKKEDERRKRTGPFEAGLALWGSRWSWDLAQSLRHAGPPLVGWLGWLGAHTEPTGPPTATIHRNRAPSNPSGSHSPLPPRSLPRRITLSPVSRDFSSINPRLFYLRKPRSKPSVLVTDEPFLVLEIWRVAIAF